MASILTYTAFLYPQMAWGSSNGTIQTTAEQTGGNEQVYLVAPSYPVATETKDDRIRWNGYASTTGTYMVVEDTATTIPLDPDSQRFYILSYTTDSLTAIVKYTNQNGSERTISTYTSYPVIVDGESYYLFKMASTTAGDTSARNIKWYINRRYILFTTLTSDNVENEVTNEASAYAYMDQLNSEHLGVLYTPEDPDLAEVLEILYPTEGTTTPATTFDLSFVFYNPAGSQVDKFNIMLFDRIISKYYFYDDDLPAGEYGEGVYELTLPASTYEATVSLYASTSPDLLRSPVSVTFSVYVDPASILGITDFGELVGLATTTCSISNLAGCFQNALMFVFYPSETVLNKFADLKGIIENKPPFGYVTVYTGQLSELSAEASSTFTLEIEDNIKEKIFDPLRTGLSSILWVCFGFWFFNRIRKQEL